MDNPEQFDHIEALKKRLYRREEGEIKIKRTDLKQDHEAENITWADQEEAASSSWISTGLLRKILLIAVGFFVLTVAAAGFLFFRGSNVISNRNIVIAIQGPVSVKAGEITPIEVTVTNKNRTPLESVDLLIEYPEGTRSATNPEETLPRQRHNLGTIAPGGMAREFDKAVIFGEQNSEKEIRLLLEYRVEGSNTIFEKEQVYKLKISDSPISVTVEAPLEVSNEREITLDITVLANSATPMGDVLLVMTYPPGFQFSQSTPAPTQANNVWSLGELKPGDEKNIKVKGILVGQAGEEKAFRVTAGVPDELRTGVEIVYGEFLRTVAVKRPFIAADLMINGRSSSQVVIKPVTANTVDVSWVNSLSVPINDGQIEIELTGAILDKSKVDVQTGFYQSFTNKIVVDKNTFSDLAVIEPGEKGSIKFNFSTLPLVNDNGRSFKNPELSFKMTFKGLRVSEGFSAEPVEVSIFRQIKVDTILTLKAKALHFIGELDNSGPMPPKVGLPTTFTMVWEAVNASNAVSGARVKAVLPPYVEWTGQIAPSTEKINYNSRTREVVWEVGSLPADTGLRGEPRVVSFQLAFTPSLQQVGALPELISGAEFSGVDNFTKSTIFTKIGPISTLLTEDPQFDQSSGGVVQ